MPNIPTNQDEVIDSRDIIERIDDLQSQRQALQEDLEAAEACVHHHHNDLIPANYLDYPEGRELARCQRECAEWDSENLEELQSLEKLQSEAESSADWIYGETLISEDYFTQYIEELIGDCYQVPKEMTSGEWPWRHMSIDYDAAAEEAKQDYMEVDFDGRTYLIRC